MHISVAEETIKKLLPSLKILEKELKRKSAEFKNIVKLEELIYKMQPHFLLDKNFQDIMCRLQKVLKE